MNSLVLCVLDLIVQTIGPKPTLNQSDTSHYILAYSLEKPSILPHNRQSRSNKHAQGHLNTSDQTQG